MEIFQDRKEAGKELGERLKKYKSENPIILAIPRGGVVVGYEVARILKAPLDVIIARKIGAPMQEELGIGAIAEGDIEVLDKRLIRNLQIPRDAVKGIIAKEKREIERRKSLYRENRPIMNLQNRTVILVDDGLATGVSARAAIEAIKKLKPKKIIFASPVCAKDTVKDMGKSVDEPFCILTPSYFNSVGAWYQNFDQVTDQEVKELLSSSQNLKSKATFER